MVYRDMDHLEAGARLTVTGSLAVTVHALADRLVGSQPVDATEGTENARNGAILADHTSAHHCLAMALARCQEYSTAFVQGTATISRCSCEGAASSEGAGELSFCRPSSRFWH